MRGDVWLSALDPTVGSEIQKMRRCLIVSPDEMNTHLRTAVIVPMTTGSKPAPFRVAVQFKGKDSLLLADQIRTVDRRRLMKHLGRVEETTLTVVLQIIGHMFAA